MIERKKPPMDLSIGGFQLSGASGGSRTRTGLTPLDFESSASASSATLAGCGQ